MRARIEAGFAELTATLKRELLPSAAEQSAKAEVDRERLEQRRAEIKAEWGDHPVPTIGGTLISRELLATMQGHREAAQ